MIRLDPQAKILLEHWSKSEQVKISDLTAEYVRNSDSDVRTLQEGVEDFGEVREFMASTLVGDIPIQVFTPPQTDTQLLPVFIYFHGGGFVIGSDSYENPIKTIVKQSKCIVCVIEYSLAPEHKFPIAVHQSMAATTWIMNNIDLFNGDKNKISLGGDSSGGNLAAIVALLNVQKKIHDFKLLVLIYPMLDATCSQPSVEEFAMGFGFTKEKIKWYFDQYLPLNANRKALTISPLFAQSLEGLPPTFIATAECDPLRDEAELFGKKLKEANIRVEIKRYSGMIHGFFQMSKALAKGKELIDDVSDRIKLNTI
jgi:acetyl esterase